MPPSARVAPLFLIAALAAFACNFPAPAATLTSGAVPSETPAPAATRPPGAAPSETPAPADTAAPEPTAAPAPALLDLEVVEWFEHANPNLADPSITDTQIEVLVRNPNEVPVYVSFGDVQVRLINAAGEAVYTNPNPFIFLWEGSWMLAGEATGLTLCACFQTDGGETQAWDSLELAAPVAPADDVVYTADVEVTLGEFFSLEEAHLGGAGLGARMTLANTSDLVLESIPLRVIARAAGSGRYIGLATYGNAVADFSGSENINPSDSAEGIVVSEIDYYDGPLTYEVSAIGIPAGQ